MNEKDMDEILLINWNLVRQKLDKPNSELVEVTRKQLTTKINQVINDRSVVFESSPEIK